MKSSVAVLCALSLALSAVLSCAGESVSLSAIPFTSYKPWMTKPAIDKSADGQPLSIGGAKFETGFGLSGRQQLVFQLDGNATQFSAMVGVDDEAAARDGVMEFRVLGDGRQILWSSGPMRQGQAAKTVALDVSGVKVLTLLCFEAGGLNWMGQGDWAQPRLRIHRFPPHHLGSRYAHARLRTWTAGGNRHERRHRRASDQRANNCQRPAQHGTRLVRSRRGRRSVDVQSQTPPQGLMQLDPATGILRGSVKKSGRYPVTISVANPSKVGLPALSPLPSATRSRPPRPWVGTATTISAAA